MYESRISAGATEKLPDSGESNAKAIAWSYDMEGRAETSVERYCELANKNIEQLFKVSTPCIDDHKFKTEEWETVGELSNVLLSNRPQVRLFGAHWQTRHSVVCRQTGTSSYRMDKNL